MIPSSTANDAAVFYFAANGTLSDLKCQRIKDDDTRCNVDMAGVSADDGTPLCDECIDNPEDVGHRLHPDTVAEIYRIKRAMIAKFRENEEEFPFTAEGI